MKHDIADLDLDSNVKEKLSLNLSSIVAGRNDVLLTPIAKEHGADFLIGRFNEVFKANQSKMNDTLLKLENSNMAKFGPRSIAVPWLDRRKSLIDSFGVGKSDIAEFDTTFFGRNTLRPLTKFNAIRLLKNSTNSGLPYYTRKGIVKERVLDKYEILLKRKDPCILFTRTQEQKKTRNVWGYPMADTLNEMRYYSPLLAFQKRLAYRAALISPTEVSKKLTDLILLSVRYGYYLQSVDFSSYDTLVKSKLQANSFKYIKSLFQVMCEAEIEYIAERFRTIGIITPEGILFGPHGVPSGSTFTNEVDSISQAMIGMGTGLVTKDCFQVQGDDGVYLLRDLSHVDALNKAFESNGLEVNKDKSYLSRNSAIYLQNLYHIDYLKDGIIGGIYPVYRALNRICFQERWSDFEDFGIKGKDFYSIRTISILENCKYHPLFKELVTFVVKYDKYSLDFSDQGLSKYVGMISQTEGADEILKHQYGDDVSGIKSFETFKLIRELG